MKQKLTKEQKKNKKLADAILYNTDNYIGRTENNIGVMKEEASKEYDRLMEGIEIDFFGMSL